MLTALGVGVSTRNVIRKPNRGPCYASSVEYRELAKKLVDLREKAKLTQQDVARRIRVPQSSISGWENWRNEDEDPAQLRRPPIPDLTRFAVACGHELELRFIPDGARTQMDEASGLVGQLETDDRELVLRLLRAMSETDDLRGTLAGYIVDLEKIVGDERRKKA